MAKIIIAVTSLILFIGCSSLEQVKVSVQSNLESAGEKTVQETEALAAEELGKFLPKNEQVSEPPEE